MSNLTNHGNPAFFMHLQSVRVSEIARHDDVLSRLKRRISLFEELLSEIDFPACQADRDRLRSEAVNLFVSVEEFLDRLISFNTWLLDSDHWGKTRFSYRISDARQSVSDTLGESIETSEGTAKWQKSGENVLGVQLAYINQFLAWLDDLSSAERVARQDFKVEESTDHCSRPFPFKHLQLWADSDPVELGRYREMFKKVAKSIGQADVAGVRNGMNHQRDASRFPEENALLNCVSRLKHGVCAAEENRIYPVTYWRNETTQNIFGSTEIVFKNDENRTFTLFRPSTVSSLPNITSIHAVIFAPVNFLGAADSLLFFRVLGESEYSKLWSGFPRLSKTALEVDTNADVAVASNV